MRDQAQATVREIAAEAHRLGHWIDYKWIMEKFDKTSQAAQSIIWRLIRSNIYSTETQIIDRRKHVFVYGINRPKTDRDLAAEKKAQIIEMRNRGATLSQIASKLGLTYAATKDFIHFNSIPKKFKHDMPELEEVKVMERARPQLNKNQSLINQVFGAR